MICPPLHRVDEMIERFVRNRNQPDMYDHVSVTVGGMLTKGHRESDVFRNDLAPVQESTAKEVPNQGHARTLEAEEVSARDNSWTELLKVHSF